jgi:hypothetical protein
MFFVVVVIFGRLKLSNYNYQDCICIFSELPFDPLLPGLLVLILALSAVAHLADAQPKRFVGPPATIKLQYVILQ